MTTLSCKWVDKLQQVGYQIILIKWWCCAKPNKRGRVSALLEPHQHALTKSSHSHAHLSIRGSKIILTNIETQAMCITRKFIPTGTPHAWFRMQGCVVHWDAQTPSSSLHSQLRKRANKVLVEVGLLRHGLGKTHDLSFERRKFLTI